MSSLAGFIAREYAVRKGETQAVADALYEMEPVSYTHLRAHETVLDLVCRLLLEKTKSSSAQYSYGTYM